MSHENNEKELMYAIYREICLTLDAKLVISSEIFPDFAQSFYFLWKKPGFPDIPL